MSTKHTQPIEDDDDAAFLSLITPIQDIDIEKETKILAAEKKKSLSLDQINSKAAQLKAKRYEEKQQQAGIVYMTRVPPTVGPGAVRGMLSQFGTILRVFFKPESDESLRRRRQKSKSSARRYEGGWIEFSDKRHAKKCAVVLNGQSMGLNTTARHLRDDIWMLQYLSKVKWNDLRLQHQHASEIHNFKTTQAIESGRIETQEFLKDFQKTTELAANQASQLRRRIKLENEKVGKGVNAGNAGNAGNSIFVANFDLNVGNSGGPVKRKSPEGGDIDGVKHVSSRAKGNDDIGEKKKTFRKLM
jgi:ESF2/ABP1 family protein